MQACKYIEEHLAVDVDSLGKDALINCAKTSMSSKIIGAESDFFSKVGSALAATRMGWVYQSFDVLSTGPA